MSRLPIAALAALLVTACAANPKTADRGTTIIDGASAAAPAPEPTPAEAAPAPPAPVAACDLVHVRFAFDSAILDDAARKALEDDARCLSQRHPTALLIEGHCDERGTAQYNVALGARRAAAVRKYLADLGVKTKFDTVSFGAELPSAQGSTEAAWAQNRRAEMRLPGDQRADGQQFAAE